MGEPATSDFRQAGSVIRTFPVRISYRILELFSGGLYSSPTKAIEELVANSYDAYANNVEVLVSPNLMQPDATIIVVDDGESMNLEGLQTLWRVGYSPKRLTGDEAVRGRLPIGKFGIGKLATWVLARELTHLCKRDGKFLAVTMFYEKMNPEKATEEPSLDLYIRDLSPNEVGHVFSGLRELDNLSAIRLFGEKASPSWTVVVMSSLKPMAQDLKMGRLRWVLSTAMPLAPGFCCYLNGTIVEPSKMRQEPLAQWIIGQDDKVAANKKIAVDYDPTQPELHKHGINLSWGARVTGHAEVYEDTLDKGKSTDWGRSHGFFIMVRGRLLNLVDPLFGNTPLSHKTFNRFRMVAHCDQLDDFLLSSREGISEKDQTDELKSYLRSKFHEAADWYEDWLSKKEAESRLAVRLGRMPRGLMQRPLINLIVNTLRGKGPFPRLTRIPTGLTAEETDALITKTEGFAETQEGFINDVVLEGLGVDRPIAMFDAGNNKVIVNSLHPFYRNYEDYFKNPEPFEILGLAEILTEAYLVEMGFPRDDINSILDMKDDFLRQLVYMRRLSAPLAADMLREAGGDREGLENAVAEGFRSLGLEVTPIGGSNEPDGLAEARMGIRTNDESLRGYKLTYDAKSTGQKRTQSGNIHIASIDRHRGKYGADFAVVVAKDFSDTKGDDSAIITEARRMNKIVLITAKDLADLVEAASVKRIGYQRLRELLESCCAPSESREWIQRFINEKSTVPPLRAIVYAVYNLQQSQRDAVLIADVRWQSKELQKLSRDEIKEWLLALTRLCPDYITVRPNDAVELQMHPDKVLQAVGVALSERPRSESANAFLDGLGIRFQPQPASRSAGK